MDTETDVLTQYSYVHIFPDVLLFRRFKWCGVMHSLSAIVWSGLGWIITFCWINYVLSGQGSFEDALS